MLKFTQQQQQQVDISLQQLRTGSARGRRSTSVTIKAQGLSNKPIQYKYITVYTHLHANGDIFEGIQKRLYTQIGSINILNLLNNSRVKCLTVSVCACACVWVCVLCACMPLYVYVWIELQRQQQQRAQQQYGNVNNTQLLWARRRQQQCES